MTFGLDIVEIIKSIGYVGIFSIIFAESGLFFGFFLPGDSVLLTAGLLSLKGDLDLRILIPLVFIGAVAGDNVGYWFGHRVGPPLFSRPESRFFKPKNLRAAKDFYDKYGPIALVLARFTPFIRPFAPIVAGAVAMEYRRFFFWNLMGGVIWGIGMTMAGYILGSLFPPEVLDKYFNYIVFTVIILSGLPAVYHFWKENRGDVVAWIRNLISRKQVPEKEE